MTTERLPRVLVVDDEPQMLTVVSFALETYDLEPVTAADAERALEILAEGDIDIVIADVMLPGLSGVELCQRIRAVGGPPVILLTAKGEIGDRLEGLEAGADDYIAKPFHPREVALRVNSVLRRPSRDALRVVEVGDLRLDTGSMTATLAGARISLSAIEFRFLLVLARHAGDPMSPENLMREVWGAEAPFGAQEIVKATVHRIRTKLGQRANESEYVVTLRGVGYMMPR
jgi:DNA-binding response OmpR family regulator